MERRRARGAGPRLYILTATLLSFITEYSTVPLGEPTNGTSADLDLTEDAGSCRVGSAVFAAGQSVPDAGGACDRCVCVSSVVSCARVRCEPRPGCKALHRPDHCCPTYQCECEQEGRVYGNGEKLVDPADPCRVCYCQGGEVVCRRIACFLRDDCRPRLVPGRCCPEYDNCPLRGVSAIPGMVSSVTSPSPIEDMSVNSNISTVPENLKKEITIKEITPVSEIPVISNVRIKEIISSPTVEIAQYVSSKSPLITREATSEKSVDKTVDTKIETPVVFSTALPVVISELLSDLSKTSSKVYVSTNNANTSVPEKTGISTRDNTNGDIKEINTAILTTHSNSPNIAINNILSTTKIPVIEEDDTFNLEHNPAFPPLPDDLSVSGNHDDDIISENAENIHIPNDQDDIVSISSSTETVTTKDSYSTTSKEIISSNLLDTSAHISISDDPEKGKIPSSSTKQKQTLNLRSVIPTDILTISSQLPEKINGQENGVSGTVSTTKISTSIITNENKTGNSITTTLKPIESDSTASTQTSIQNELDKTTSSLSKSNVATEVTSQTELSSLPIETSDQNPHETIEEIKDKFFSSTADPSLSSRNISTNEFKYDTDYVSTTDKPVDIIETTEYSRTLFDSIEVTTDIEELIKKSSESKNNSAIIEQNKKGFNVLTDLINIVGDVASMNDHTTEPEERHVTTNFNSISESEELIPVNAGYKSRNNNWNFNSITEIPIKYKNQAPHVNKQKIVEIDDDETAITDSQPPDDKIEPTTRRPIIDNVSDDKPENKTERKDIEIITKSYVPTINRRPTKAVLKKTNEKFVSEDITTEGSIVSISSELVTNSWTESNKIISNTKLSTDKTSTTRTM